MPCKAHSMIGWMMSNPHYYPCLQFADNLVTQFERGVMAYDEKDSDMVNIVQEVFDCCGATDYQVEYSDFMSVSIW